MTKKELEQSLIAINQRLVALGELNTLVQQGGKIPQLINEVENKKNNLEIFLGGLPQRKEEFNGFMSEVKALKEQLVSSNDEVSGLSKQVQELHEKTEGLIKEARAQLGIAANAKLASTFEQVKKDLETEKAKWFYWFLGAVGTFVVGTAFIVWWQITAEGTLYHLSFPVRLALVSPLGYFAVFINREYSKVRNLIEEYTFKAAVARSFEAYKEIVQSVDSPESKETFNLIVRAINALYSSPMRNIKSNYQQEQESGPDVLSQIRSLIDSDKGTPS